jgi:hypothetical protein
MDVKFEGKNVCRHFDITTSNHASSATTTAPLVSLEMLDLADSQYAVDVGVCPCCGEALHQWQQGPPPEPRKKFKVVQEQEFWSSRIKRVADDSLRDKFRKDFANLMQKKAAQRALAKSGKKSCGNVHPNPNSGCAVYFDMTRPAAVYPGPGAASSTMMTAAEFAKRRFKSHYKSICVDWWEKKTGKTYRGKKMKFNHKTPRMAGGCNNPRNVIPEDEMTDPECVEIERLQSELENVTGVAWK